MTDIVERLRVWPAGYGEDTLSSTVVGKIMKDAADEIERLRNVAQSALIGRLKNKADEQTTALDQIMTTAADNLASPGSDLKMTLEFIRHVAEHTLALTSAQCGEAT